MATQNNRTHEPNLRELTGQLDDLRELFEKVSDERDRRYEQRFIAMDEKTSLALSSSKEAVTKAEIATEKRFDSVNEFRNTLKDQQNTLFPRTEAEARFKAIEEKIEDVKTSVQGLRESRSESGGEKAASVQYRQQSNWASDHFLSILAFLVSLTGLIIIIAKGGK